MDEVISSMIKKSLYGNVCIDLTPPPPIRIRSHFDRRDAYETFDTLFFHDGGRYHIETGPFIFRHNPVIQLGDI